MTEHYPVKYYERKLLAVAQQSHYAIALADLNGKIEYANPMFYTLTGFSPEEISGKTLLTINDWQNSPDAYQKLVQSLNERQVWEGECCNKRSSGKPCWEHITISPIRDISGEVVCFSRISLDITDRIELQKTMNRDLMLAGNIQKYFIPKIENDKKVVFETIYEPHLHVSGDVIDFGWNDQKTILYGYVLDVMGHGIATALQTSALRVLFRQTFHTQLLPGEKLNWINQQSAPYFAEDFFAAAIYFEFDFDNHILRYSAAGLNYFLANTEPQKGVIGIPGSLLGIGPVLYCDECQLQFKSGDYFCFMSDGLLDILGYNDFNLDVEFNEFVDFLRTKAHSDIRKDDISAICIYIR